MQKKASCFENVSIFHFTKVLICLFALSLFQSCGSSGTDYVEETLEDPTQGIIAEIQEVRADNFKITNEELIERREDSRIIATFLNGTIDTFTLDEVQLVKQNSGSRSVIRSIALGGMMGYMMGRTMGSGVNRNSYATDDAFRKSTATTEKLRSTSIRRTVRKPKPKSSSGFGKSKSTKSFGG